jgi:Ca2+/Na+ antiporter
MKIFFPAAWLVSKIKKILKCKTYHIESAFVLVVLVIVAVISGAGSIEWLGVGAVFFTFGYTSISSRLEEAEHKRHQNGEEPAVDCYPKLQQYFYAKEILWTAYFVLLGAWSALVGVAVFLVYPYWRKAWRAYQKKGLKEGSQ